MKEATFFFKASFLFSSLVISLACNQAQAKEPPVQIELSRGAYSTLSYFSNHGTHVPPRTTGERIQDTQSLEAWLGPQARKSVQGLFLNISPAGAAVGSVSASPSRRDPDYFFHWVRDSSLVMGVALDLYSASTDSDEREFLLKVLEQFVDFSRRNQLTVNLSGTVGEPKFNMDGSAFMGEWGRPQNDGPALRAVTAIRFARVLLAAGGRESYVRSKLYDGLIPSHSLIKTDLEFVSHHWQDSSFDLWEEVKGTHFYTRMVQRRALLEGAALAEQLGDGRAGVWYRSQAREIEVELMRHWDSSHGYWVATLDWVGGSASKSSGLDVAVILGALHGTTSDGFMSPGSDRMVATAEKLREVFHSIYPVNQVSGMGTAIGRYPEDIYDGLEVGGRLGNPWVLATLAFAEFNYRIAQEWGGRRKIEITPLNLSYIRRVLGDAVGGRRGLKAGATLEHGSADFDLLVSRIREEGDSYLARAKYHTPQDGAFAEQFHRETGFMQGARDLAWSYASLITALNERNRLLSLTLR